VFKFNFIINDLNHSNLLDVDETFLRYLFLEGNVKLQSNKATINIDWNIPLLDFALAMRLISLNLNTRNDSDQCFDFTESDDEIYFSKLESDLVISTTFSEEVIKTKTDEFSEAVKIFYNEITNEILNKYPELTKNKSYQRIINENPQSKINI